MTWLIKLLEQMSPQIVAAFKSGLVKLLQELAVQAAKTENKWDDWGIAMIAKVLGVEIDVPASVEGEGVPPEVEG